MPIAEYLLPELDGRDGGDFSGVVVSDSLFATINPVQRDLYTGFYVDPFQQTVGIASRLADKGKVSYESKSPYAVVVSGTLFEIQRTLYSTMLFASLLVGTVFLSPQAASCTSGCTWILTMTGCSIPPCPEWA